METGLKHFLIPLAVILATTFALFVIRNIFFRHLHKWAGKTGKKIGDLVIATFKTPSIYWSIVVGLYLGISISELPAQYVFYSIKAIHVIITLSVTIATANLFVKIFENYTQRSRIPIPTAGIMYGVLKGTILIIGILIMLGMLGISITPLITALGIGGLAVALALQDTLSNLFSGLNIIASMQLKAGDYIKLNTGEEGYISDITWRNTTIRALSNNMIIIPNSKLASAIITNYDLPEKEMAVSLQVTVGHGNDLERVERITVDAARNIMETIPGGIPQCEPSVRYTSMGATGIVLSVNFRVRTVVDQYLVRHEFIKMLAKRYKEEGIDIPSSPALLSTNQQKRDER